MSDGQPQGHVSRALLDAAVASATNGIVLADATQPDLPLVFVNPAFERMTGYRAADAVGVNCRFLQGPSVRQKGLDTLRRTLREGGSCNVVLKNYRKDGTPFWNELFVAPIRNENEEITHYVGVQTDVTRRIEAERGRARLERQLRARNEQLEGLNEEKNALLGMAAHDIRNPLTTILLNVDLLRRMVAPLPSPARPQQAVKRIGDSARFMLDLVNELLDVTKIESGRVGLEREAVDLPELIRERLPVHRQSAEAKGIAVRSRCESGLPPADADRARIAQVLDNLLSNAVKFSHAGSAIRVQAGQQDGLPAVSVTDQGQGIPPAERDRLFQPFAKTSVRGTAGESSTGLGLAICRKIIDAHGGTIEVESEVGKGSTFRFTLPAHR